MENFKTNCSENHLKTYVFLYIRNTLPYTKRLLHFNLNLLGVNDIEFDKINKEYKTESDYQSIQKICGMVENSKISKDQLLSLFDEIKGLFNSINNADRHLSNILLLGLERILTKAA